MKLYSVLLFSLGSQVMITTFELSVGAVSYYFTVTPAERSYTSMIAAQSYYVHKTCFR